MNSSSDPWLAQGYEVVLTFDGSPSLRSLATANLETMHHSGGAWSETLYIYGVALALAFEKIKSQKHQILSVGLGLGYNEFLSLALAAEKKVNLVKLFSFETDPFLIHSLENFCQGTSLPGEIEHVYEQIAQAIHKKFANFDCRQALAKAREQKIWQQQGALSEKWSGDGQASVILYDAFSSKSTPELWQEDFLNFFLRSSAAQECVFSTYACTGALKRALRNQNFQVFERPGFQGKRSSTIAWRSPDLPRTPDFLSEFFNVFDDQVFGFGL